LRECGHLTIEHLGIPEVIPDARQRPTVARQGDCGKRTSPRAKPADELSREMARLRRASAISEADNLASALKRFYNRRARGGSTRRQRYTALRDYLDVSAEVFREAVAQI
jgi:hypothetical protein